MGDDRREIVELRLPAEFSADAVGAGDDRGGIAGAARCVEHREVLARKPLHGVDHIEYRIAAAIAAIQGETAAARAEMPERVEMGGDEIGDVNVVADASAV